MTIYLFFTTALKKKNLVHPFLYPLYLQNDITFGPSFYDGAIWGEENHYIVGYKSLI